MGHTLNLGTLGLRGRESKADLGGVGSPPSRGDVCVDKKRGKGKSLSNKVSACEKMQRHEMEDTLARPE